VVKFESTAYAVRRSPSKIDFGSNKPTNSASVQTCPARPASIAGVTRSVCLSCVVKHHGFDLDIRVVRWDPARR